MRFGICCSLNEVSAAMDAGFDYVELPAANLLDHEDEYYRAAPEVTNVFFAGGLSIHGVGHARALEYAQDTIDAAARVGIEVMVVGSAGARQAPSASEVDACNDLFVEVAKALSDMAQPHGITIAPESLNRGECNVGVDLGQLATSLHHKGVAYTADSYHVLSEWIFAGNEIAPTKAHWEAQLPFQPAHVHIGSRSRVDPQPNDPDLMGFVRRLRELDYDGRVSLECRRFNDQRLTDALRQLRLLFGE